MRLRLHRSTSLSQATLRELWRLRMSLIRLKPSVSHDDDFAAFAADFGWHGYVWILRDAGEVVGFFLQRARPIDFQGRKLLCFLPDYGFAAPRIHGHPASAASTCTRITSQPTPIGGTDAASSSCSPSA